MNVVGIDVSKGKSTVAVLRPLGVTVRNPFEVAHTVSALKELADSLKGIDGETRVVMEHTGRYYEPVAQALHAQGLFVSAVNPLLIREYGGNSLRRVKTDRADAKKIARYGLDNWAELRRYSPVDIIRCELKTLNRQFQLASKNRTAASNNLTSLLDASFPALKNYFPSAVRANGTQKWVDFAKTFWHVECVSRMTLKAFSKRYQTWCKRNGYNFNSQKAESIYASTKEQLPTLPKSPTTMTMVQAAAAYLTSTSRMVELLRAQMNLLASRLPEYPVVMSMYGVGESLGPQLIAEIGDVSRFANKRALVAFAGVDPIPNQSGIKNVRSNRSSKRGSPYLRKTLFLVMYVLLQNAPPDEPVYQFLNRKYTEGKPFYVCMTAAANKFLRVYYGKVNEYLNGLKTSGDPPSEGQCASPAL